MGKKLEQDGKGFLKLTDKTRVAVVGSRHYDDYRHFRKVMDEELKGQGTRTIVTGDADGVDAMARLYAADHNLSLEVKEAEWDKYGKPAGPIRNKEIIDSVSFLIAFWDGQSPGTKNAIEQAERHLEEVAVHRLDTWEPPE